MSAKFEPSIEAEEFREMYQEKRRRYGQDFLSTRLAPEELLRRTLSAVGKLFKRGARGAPATAESGNDRAADIGQVSVGERGAISAGVQGAEAGF